MLWEPSGNERSKTSKEKRSWDPFVKRVARMQLVPIKKLSGKKKGKLITLKNSRKTRLYKNIPDKCSTVRRICIKCLKNTIRKNDLNYESKICKECS